MVAEQFCGGAYLPRVRWQQRTNIMISFALAGNWDGPCLQRRLWLLQTTTWLGPKALEKHRRHQFVQPVIDVNGLLTACKHTLKIYPVSKHKASSLLNGLATLYPNWSRLIVFSGPKRHQFIYWASAVLGQGDICQVSRSALPWFPKKCPTDKPAV